MKLRSLITLEMYQAIRNIPHVSITPYTPRVRQVPMGSMRKMGVPDLVPGFGDIDKVLPSKPPSNRVTNIDHVCQQAKTFGIRSNV